MATAAAADNWGEHSRRTIPALGLPPGPGKRTYQECLVHDDPPMVNTGVR